MMWCMQTSSMPCLPSCSGPTGGTRASSGCKRTSGNPTSPILSCKILTRQRKKKMTAGSVASALLTEAPDDRGGLALHVLFQGQDPFQKGSVREPGPCTLAAMAKAMVGVSPPLWACLLLVGALRPADGGQ